VSDKPYGTWTKGPSPKQVYAACSERYVGYVPVALRVVHWHRDNAYGSELSSYGEIRTYKHKEFECVTKLDGLFGDVTQFSYVCDDQITYMRTDLTNAYVVRDQPRWQMFFLDTLSQYPRLYGGSSFYLFEDFVINDDHDVLQWAKYARKATWRALESLDELPKGG